jgi:hypothetical protein
MVNVLGVAVGLEWMVDGFGFGGVRGWEMGMGKG